MTEKNAQAHNRRAKYIIERILNTKYDGKISQEEMIILLESVVVGTLLIIMKYNTEDKILDLFLDRVRSRIKENKTSKN